MRLNIAPAPEELRRNQDYDPVARLKDLQV
jgi:hypothetical protein